MIRQPLLFGLGGLAFVVGVMLFMWDGVFWLTANETTGTVSSVEAHDTRCGSKTKHDCTKFTAIITFDAGGTKATTSTSAGDERGHGVSVSHASHHVGERVPVLYSPLDPTEASTTDFWDVWGMPVFAFIAAAVMMVASLFEGRTRRSSLW